MKILLYCKNTEGNEQAVQIAVDQAKAFDASIHLVRGISEKKGVPREIIQDAIAKAEKKMQQYIDTKIAPAGIVSSMEVVATPASLGEMIVKTAEKNGVGTIVMSIQKRSKVGKMVFGSNSQYIILEAPCKVITVK